MLDDLTGDAISDVKRLTEVRARWSEANKRAEQCNTPQEELHYTLTSV